MSCCFPHRYSIRHPKVKGDSDLLFDDMHSRNPYRQPIDFAKFASKYTPLAKYLSSRSTIDFKDDHAQRALTQALLEVDFGLHLELPENRLCPPVPNRLNYVLWIQDILASTPTPPGTVLGLDIGTGASAIYPLLACALEPGWEMLATEIDPLSLSYAQKNVSRNVLQHRIRVVDVSGSIHIFGPLFPRENDEAEEGKGEVEEEHNVCKRPVVDFTMCNPPFYSSIDEIRSSRESKDGPSLSSCTGSQNEIIYPPSSSSPGEYAEEGGEVAFVARMVQESVRLGGHRCRWYTSMLGKLSSVPKIVNLVKQFNIENYAITEFIQGQTKRWGIAWSFNAWRLPDTLARVSNISAGHVLCKIQPGKTMCEFVVRVVSGKDGENPLKRVLDAMSNLDVHEDVLDEEQEAYGYTVCARENTWSRTARRGLGKRKRNHDESGSGGGKQGKQGEKKDEEGNEKDRETEPYKMICGIRLVRKDGCGAREGEGREMRQCLHFRWVYGWDRGMYEGFVSHVARKVGKDQNHGPPSSRGDD